MAKVILFVFIFVAKVRLFLVTLYKISIKITTSVFVTVVLYVVLHGYVLHKGPGEMTFCSRCIQAIQRNENKIPLDLITDSRFRFFFNEAPLTINPRLEKITIFTQRDANVLS